MIQRIFFNRKYMHIHEERGEWLYANIGVFCFAMCSHTFDRSSTILSSLSIKVVSRIDVLAVKMVKMPNHCIYNLVKKKKKKC